MSDTDKLRVLAETVLRDGGFEAAAVARGLLSALDELDWKSPALDAVAKDWADEITRRVAALAECVRLAEAVYVLATELAEERTLHQATIRERDRYKALVEDAVYTHLCDGTMWERHARAALAGVPGEAAQKKHAYPLPGEPSVPWEQSDE